ncbi:hexokinase-1 [Arthroderma uncinatum]|uniref:hexokinase-1 n=1 Tax=Arthroderma uncinatum TaxID=74035 RepID=UPI00144AB46C|nr:hexokinase-1 [Arthroderma uncinatum]KAF3482215.1 hexokinase-1 [Arthroderma uncinatum]
MSVHSAGEESDHNVAMEPFDGEDEDSIVDEQEIEEQAMQDQLIDNFLAPLAVNDARLYQLGCRFSQLYLELARTSDQQFLPTPVTRLPNGQETGRYLAIDVGGSNLRVAFIELLGAATDHLETSSNGSESVSNSERSRDTLRKAQRHRVRRTLEKAWPIAAHLKMDKAEDLFLWIGDCMAEVVADSLATDTASKEAPEELEMGITFSFPMMQDSLSEATLMPMGKGFAITSDLNLGKILLAGYDRHTRRPYGSDEPSAKRRRRFALPKLKIAAITNDTVATLASLAYMVKSLPNSRVAMGLIVGTGCNATIPMKLSDLHESKAKHVSSRHPEATETVVNTEFTLGGAAPPLRDLKFTTKWDIQLDEQCARPGFQPFEYMTGGRYIGELVRLVFHDYLTSVLGLAPKALPANLIQGYALSTGYLSGVVAPAHSDQQLLIKLKATLPPPESSSWNWDIYTARAFRKTARIVQTRSAGLVAAAVVGLLACQKEIQLRSDGATNPKRSTNIIVPSFNNSTDTITSVYRPASTTPQGNGDPSTPGVDSPPSGWQSGPEELVVAYTGGIIQHYPHFKETCQGFIDRLVIWDGPQESGKSVFLREASDGGIIGAGVLAGMVSTT